MCAAWHDAAMTQPPPMLPIAPLPGDGAVVVGLSGGLDSTVLLHALAATPPMRERGLRAVHVHHGLHADAHAWAAHCATACDALGIPCTVVRVNVARDGGSGPEAAARAARHAAFAAQLGEGEVLALAHHRDDQAETFLLRALRASGPDGLGAMRALRPFARGLLWRPLLALPRATLADYARAHALDWIEDPSNTDTAFDRNLLRSTILPLLRERWPDADAALARSAALSADAAALLDAEDARALATARTLDPHALSRAALAALPAARLARVLRRWITALALPPLPAEGVRAATAFLDVRDDARARFDWSGATLQAWRDVLHAAPAVPAWPCDWQAEWDGSAPLSLPDGRTLALEGAAAFDAPLTVRARTGGERIRLPGRGHSHAVKHVLQDLGVPPWERARLPLLVDPGGAVQALGDLAFSAAFDTWLRERDAGLAWVRD